MPTSEKPYHHGDLRRALVRAGSELLAEQGAAALSLREAARRLGVSHNAPYKHFPTREALLAAIAAEGFEQLRRSHAGADGMEARGLAYVTFALDHPALFRLMFSGELDAAAFPELQAAIADGLDSMRDMVAETYGSEALAEATLSAWSFVHGLACLLLDGQISEPMLAGRTREEMARAVLAAMAHALSKPPQPPV